MFGNKKRKSKDLAIAVKVGRAPGTLKDVALNGERTVMDAINAAGLVKKDSEIVSVNGQQVDEDELDTYTLENKDRVTLVRNVEGGVVNV
jgi:sulfur carrier protein ThiS